MEFVVKPKKLKLGNIPTKLQVLQAILYEKRIWMRQNVKKKEPKISLIADVVTRIIQKIYSRAGIKVLRKDKIKEKIIKIYNFRKSLLKVSKIKRNTKAFTRKKNLYKSFMAKFLDVECRNKDAKKNKANSKKKNIRELCIEPLDEFLSNESSDTEPAEDYDDPDFVPHGKRTPKYNQRKDLSEIAEVQSRYTSSDRLTAAIVNATLRTFDIPVVVDKSKLRRSHKRKFSEMDEWTAEFGGGLYYDSRKDESKVHSKKADEHGKLRYYRSTVKESHYSLVSQPEGLFLGYVVPEGGTADKVSKTISSFLKDKNMFDVLIALGSDGENLNVGADGGINYYIEAELGRPLHWFVCLLHTNELPLKNLINKLDGKTTSSNTFSGPVGKSLENVSLPVVKFKRFRRAEKIPEIPEIAFKKLSNDQMYLYRIVNALVTGDFPKSLANLKIGPLNHSRWITTASRICKIYATTLKPSKTLQDFTSYIVNVYAPTWFQIKRNELAVNGPKNLFFLIERSNRIEDKEVKSIVQKCIQRNAFFAHSENLLLAQLSSKDPIERLNGVNRVLEIRENNYSTRIRRLRVPTINFGARKWTNMIEWDDTATEPPLTTSMNEEEVMDLVENPLNVPRFKCHTQMVERAVKEVTRVSSKFIHHDKRNATVSATLINRAKYPKMDSKKDFLIKHKTSKFLPKI